MDTLPVEIIEKIFKNLRFSDLKQASAVCRLWYGVYQRSAFMSKMVVHFKKELTVATMALFLASDCRYQNIRFTSIPFYDLAKSKRNLCRRDVIHEDEDFITGLRKLLDKFSDSLQLISLCKCNLERTRFHEFLQALPELKVLEVEECVFAGEDPDETLNLPKLKQFNFKFPEDEVQRFESGHIYGWLVGNSCCLTKLKLQLCVNEMFGDLDSDLWYQVKAVAKLVRQHKKTMKSFKVDSFNDPCLKKLVFEDDELQLEKVVLGELKLRTDDQVFYDFVAKHKKIKKLDIAIESQLDANNDLYLKAICENLPLLEQFYFDMSRSSDSGLEHLQKLHKLKNLVLTKNRNTIALTEHCFDHIFMPNLKSLGIYYKDLQLPAVQQIPVSFPNLMALNLSECEKAVTDATVQLLFQSLPTLESLDLSKCKQLTEAAFLGPARVSALRKLKDLVLEKCPGVTDVSLQTFDNRALRSISVAMCTRITNVGWEALCRGCPNLTWLNASHCTRNFDNESARIVATMLPELEILNLFKNAALTNEAVYCIVENCRYLEDLCLTKCRGVKMKKVEYFDDKMNRVNKECLKGRKVVP
uniref:F-box/LRR-repeat protein 2 n=1 Tax=Culex pipiens TaxID=7175 RepID=A0A8D8KHB8_CULPI